jgi:hypothetical protein
MLVLYAALFALVASIAIEDPRKLCISLYLVPFLCLHHCGAVRMMLLQLH